MRAGLAWWLAGSIEPNFGEGIVQVDSQSGVFRSFTATTTLDGAQFCLRSR